jgi:hypothetical protein
MTPAPSAVRDSPAARRLRGQTTRDVGAEGSDFDPSVSAGAKAGV